MKQRKKNFILSAVSRLTILVLSFSLIFSPTVSYAQSTLNLPVPGTMITLSPTYNPAIVTGIKIYPDNPLQFDFIIDIGDDQLQGEVLRQESQKLINYFMATLTVPEDEMWVNLSPYEKDRIIAEGLSYTEMGRDMLAQDYMLKQLTASLVYPENDFGKEFWNRVYSKVEAEYGTTEIPMNTFNKIWIVPNEAIVYVRDTSVFVVENHLKVMLEEDYLALESNVGNTKHGLGSMTKDDLEVISGVSAEIVRKVLLPEIEKEVNEGKNFSNLRQMYNSMLLATWYKKNLKESLLGQVYANKNKVNGIELDDKKMKQKIYDQYIEAFEKGVYNYIKEDIDPFTQKIIPRKYFSGGFEDYMSGENMRFSQVEGEAPSTLVTRVKRSHVVAKMQGRTLGSEEEIISSPVLNGFKTLTSLPIKKDVENKVFSFFELWKDISAVKNLGEIDLFNEIKDKSFYVAIKNDRGPPEVTTSADVLTFSISLADNNPLILSVELFRYALENYLNKIGFSEQEVKQTIDESVQEFSFQLFQNSLQNEDDLTLAYKAAYYLEDFGEEAVSTLAELVRDETKDSFTRMHSALTLWKINSDNAYAKQVLQVYREKHDVFSEAVQLLEDYESIDEDIAQKQDQPQHGMYITLVSLHGLIKQDQALGIDADTGGQVLYVLELARALGRIEGVDRVDLVTRLMPGFKGTDTPEYAQEKEILSEQNNVNIMRIPFSGDQYKPKEKLWGDIGEFTDNLMNFFEQQERYPSMLWTHYADAGVAGAMLSKKLKNTEVLHTVHSLGIPKLANTVTRETFDNTNDKIHIFTRVLAEEIHLSEPTTTITNSLQESVEQVGMYANSELGKTSSIPPGVNLEKFTYNINPGDTTIGKRRETRALIEQETMDQLSEDRQGLAPIGLFARFDEKKNPYGMVKAYGENKELQAIANLYIGVPKTVDQLEGNERRIFNEIQTMIEEYGIGDKVVFSTAGVSYMPEVYRWLVDRKGVFMNMAFTEPFGLMVIEARAVGVPVIATDNGGPQESVHDGKDGLLVNVRDHVAVGDAITKVLSNADLWQEFSVQGKIDVNERYTWGKTAQRGMDTYSKLEKKAAVNNVLGEAQVFDKAKVSSPLSQDYGGIDLNPNNINLNERGDKVQINLPLADIENLNPESIKGILPVIINISPLPSVLPLLGLEPQKEENYLEVSSLN